MSFRFLFDLIRVSLFVFISFRFHFDSSSCSLRFLCDLMSISFRFHFGLVSNSLRFHRDLTSVQHRFLVDFTLDASAALARLARLACFALLALVLADLSALPRCLWFVRSICSVAGRLLCSSWLLMLRVPLFAALVFEAGFAHARSQLRRFV